MKVTYVKVAFDNGLKYYNYYTTEDTEVGDYFLVVAPRGPAVVRVVDIVGKNSTAKQPLVAKLDLEYLKLQRNEIQERVNNFSKIEKELKRRVAEAKERIVYEEYAKIDPEISKLTALLEQMNK